VAQSRLSRPGWRILIGAGLAALAYWGMPPMLRSLDFFRVRRVEVRGLVNLRPDSVAAALGLGPGANLFDPVAPLEKRAAAVPGVESARIGRRVPGTLVVTVAEWPVIALVGRGGRLRLVGEDGRVLPFDPTVAAPDLPVVDAPDSLVTRLLARLRDSDATLFGQVTEAARRGADVVLTADGRWYWFRPDASVETFRAVTEVTEALARRDRPWAVLDARFDGQIVVRWRAG
jgi:cell division septal protein FtsQ